MNTYLEQLKTNNAALQVMLQNHPTSPMVRHYLKAALKIKEELPSSIQSWEEWEQWLSTHPEPDPPHPLADFNPLLVGKEDGVVELQYTEKKAVRGILDIERTGTCDVLGILQKEARVTRQVLEPLLSCTSIKQLNRVEEVFLESMEDELTRLVQREFLRKQPPFDFGGNPELYYGQIDVEGEELLGILFMESKKLIKEVVNKWLKEVIQLVRTKLEVVCNEGESQGN